MFQPFSLNIKGDLREYDRPQVMGIINLTDDSFYKESRSRCDYELEKRVSKMVEDGADFIDVGAYSTRPGSQGVTVEEEISRLTNGLQLIRKHTGKIPISVDTFRSIVAERCVIECGADIINDVSGGTLDPKMFSLVAKLKVPYILMHMRGNPETMSSLTDYKNVTADIVKDLSAKLRELRLLGVSDVIIDPGFGFSKTLEQNFELLHHLKELKRFFNEPILTGVSRKSMIYKPLHLSPEEALNGTTVLNTLSLTQGTSFLRVHDVKEAHEAVILYTLSNL